MKISAHILPRRVILGALVLLGLGLRLWGLAWGPDQAGAAQPDEWAWQIIQALSWDNPTYPGLWTQTFYSLAALVREALSALAGWVGVWLGQVRTTTELAVSPLLAGRLTVALLGTGQVWMAYLVGRRYFDSVATGLLAAGVLAVSPLLVAQGHYLSLDVPLGLAVLFCLWAARNLVAAPGGRSQALAGLALGLTLTTKASGLMVLPVFALAQGLALARREPGPRREPWLWAACFLLGLGLGLLLGYPGFLLRLPEVGDVLGASVRLPGGPGPWLALLGRRWQGLTLVLGSAVGPLLALSWLAATGLIVWRRLWARLLLVIFPPLYLLAGLLCLRGSLDGQVAVWLPVAALAACWPPVVLCRRLPGRWWPVAGVSLLGALLCLPGLWRSLGEGYLFWQQDTFQSASFWLEANLPPQAQILAGPRTPLTISASARPLAAFPGLETPGGASHGYLVTSSLGEDGDPCAQEPAWEKPLRGLQLLQSFDLRAGWGTGAQGGPCHPRWVSPQVRVHALRPARTVLNPLALWRPPVGSLRGHAVIETTHPAYSRAENTMWLAGPGIYQRVLRAPKTPRELGLDLSNQGQELARLEVWQGPFHKRELTIYPGQEVDLTLPARNWPWMVQGFLPVRVVVLQGRSLVARLDWDPLLLGRRALEAGDYARAAVLLERAAAGGAGGFDALALLAGSQARLGLWDQASHTLETLAQAPGQPASAYLALAAEPADPPGPAWEERFGALTGYYPDLLRQASSRSYAIQGPLCQSEGQEVPLAGPGFHGAYLRGPGKPGGHLRLWLEAPMQAGQYRVDLRLSSRPGAPAGPLALAEVWAHDLRGSSLLASRRINTADLAGGEALLGLPLALPRSGARLELRLNYLSAWDLRLQELTVASDLKAHMRSILRWYHDANGLVALHAGRFTTAAASLEALLDLDPGFSEAYLPLAQALIDSGRLAQARQRVRQAEELFFAWPERLARVRDLYQVLRLDEDSARVDRRLADLRPSLRRQARFASGLTLLGYDLGQSQLSPGEQVDLSYYWQAWSRPPLNYYIFVHLKGPDRIITFDHLLDHGRQDMPGLAVGQVVRENYRVTIPADAPPGRYRLLVGMWDPSYTGNRVPVLEGEGQGGDEVTLSTVVIR